MEEKTLDSIESELSKLEGQGAVMNVEETPKQSLPVMQSGEVDKETVSNFKNQTLMQIQQDFSQGKVDADEQGRRFQIIEIPPLTEEQILNSLRTRRENEKKYYYR